MKTTLLLLLLLVSATRALLPNVTCLCAGGGHSCLLSGLGETVCWGDGQTGCLGYCSTMMLLSPSAALILNPGGVQVTQTGAVPVVKIACGADFTMALLADGEARGFGSNSKGQLGLAHTQRVGDNELPWQPPGGPVTIAGPARDVCAGEMHACAVMDTPNLGRAACWGLGTFGQLGFGNPFDIGEDETVASVGFVDVGGSGNVSVIFCGGYHTLALMSDGALRGWGANTEGQLGLGHTQNVGDSEHPSSQPDLFLGLGPDAVEWASAGYLHSCITTSAGRGKCFGSGGSGRLGTGNENSVTDPGTIGFLDFGVGEFVVQLEAFYAHTCALLRSGDVKCFGVAANGRLGCGWQCLSRFAPNETVALSSAVSRLAVGSYADHAIVSHPNGSFQAWGYGLLGQLGYGNTENVGDDETPASVGNVGFPDGVGCAVPLPVDTLTATMASVTATTASKTVTEPSLMATLASATRASLTGIETSLTATLASSTRASHTGTGITWTPRSRPATLTNTATAVRSTTPPPLASAAAASSTSSSARSNLLLFVFVGAAVVVCVLVVLGVAAMAWWLVVRRRRGADSEEVAMSPAATSDGLTYANTPSVVDVPGADGLTYAHAPSH